jgi:hypothetical protein
MIFLQRLSLNLSLILSAAAAGNVIIDTISAEFNGLPARQRGTSKKFLFGSCESEASNLLQGFLCHGVMRSVGSGIFRGAQQSEVSSC